MIPMDVARMQVPATFLYALKTSGMSGKISKIYEKQIDRLSKKSIIYFVKAKCIVFANANGT